MRRSVAIAILAGLLAMPLVAQTLEIGEAYPLENQSTSIRVAGDDGPIEGAVVEVIYRPNSQTGSTEVLPPTDSNGTVDWTPTDAGIVTLNARAGSEDGEVIATKNLSVRFGSFPGSGLLIMIVAGILLFGGAGFGFIMLFSEGQGEIVAEEPPST